MPLDRQHVTVASRIMLPAYLVFFAVLGVASITTPLGRLTRSPMLDYANQIMSLRAWGSLFVACALLMAFALLTHNRDRYRYALLLCGFSMTLWTIVAIVGVFAEPISYSAWVWPALVTAACFASDRSLVHQEQDQPRGN